MPSNGASRQPSGPSFCPSSVPTGTPPMPASRASPARRRLGRVPPRLVCAGTGFLGRAHPVVQDPPARGGHRGLPRARQGCGRTRPRRRSRPGSAATIRGPSGRSAAPQGPAHDTRCCRRQAPATILRHSRATRNAAQCGHVRGAHGGPGVQPRASGARRRSSRHRETFRTGNAGITARTHPTPTGPTFSITALDHQQSGF